MSLGRNTGRTASSCSSNGARLTIGGLDTRERVDKILGLEFVSVFLNEASQIPYDSALVAFTRLAQVVPGLTQRAYVDLNPTSEDCIGPTSCSATSATPTRDAAARRTRTAYARAFLNPRRQCREPLAGFYRGLGVSLPERQRKRFYEGVYVDAVDDALWDFETIERHRCLPETIPVERRAAVVVAVDPSGAAGHDDLGSDEIGIVVAARGEDGDCYVLADRSCREAPAVWGRRAVAAFHEFSADCIVAESNFGGEMVRATIQAADRNVPVRLVTASRGKAVRAEPISVRYAHGEVHHAGRFAKLEDQLCAFAASGYGGSGSPDHADAAIWALTHLFGADDTAGIIEFYRRQAQDNP